MQLEFFKDKLADEMIAITLKTPFGNSHVASDFLATWEETERGESLVLRVPSEGAEWVFSRDAISAAVIDNWLGGAHPHPHYIPSDFETSWEMTEEGESLFFRLREDADRRVMNRRKAQREADEEERRLDHAPGSEPPGCDAPGSAEDSAPFFR